jgi:hypothetical protein
MMRHRIDVYPESGCEVTVNQISERKWKASGTFMGKPLQVYGRSGLDAVSQWQRKAEWRYRTG